MKYVSRTPFRISFFGGGTDYPQWYRREEDGAVLSTSIDKYCYVGCRARPRPEGEEEGEPTSALGDFVHIVPRESLRYLGWDEGIDIRHAADLPGRSGIGSSSSFIVGLARAIAALRGETISAHELALRAIEIEQNVLRQNVGSQDQVAAAYGGLNFIRFKGDGSVVVERIAAPAERVEALESRLMLFHTGTTRIASEIAGSVILNIRQHRRTLRRMREAVDEGIAILNGKGALDDFGELLHRSWTMKKELSSLVSNSAIDGIYETAIRNGAIGGKLLGAGAGGFMLFYVPEEKRGAVEAALPKNRQVRFRFETTGSSLTEYPFADFQTNQ